MNQVRRLKNIEEFKMVFEWLATGRLDTLQEQLSVLAELCVERAARWQAPASIERRSWAVMALGKLGGIELSVHSDLDLVVLYDGDPSDSRLFEQHQAFVGAMQSFLDQPTSEGIVYHVDTRLRPEGRKGAPAIPIAMFARYLETRAAPWERLAWTRCRPLAVLPEFAERIQTLVNQFVYGPWDPELPSYMRDIRTRMERELAHEHGQRFDFKTGKGALADIDFALQLIQIREGHQRREFRVPGTRRLLAALPDTQYMSVAEAGHLREAHTFLRTLELIARMDNDTNVSWISADAGEIAPLGVRMGFDRASAGEKLLDKYHQITANVRSLYLSVLERV
jgi:glutamate-ammonia-ligase adenylyltransferase